MSSSPVATIKLLVKEISTLQCIKCAIRHDLLFREPAPSSILEGKESDNQEPENVNTGRDSGEPGLPGDKESGVEEFSWDGFLIEDEDEEDMYCSE